jgi:hypothetical protein
MKIECFVLGLLISGLVSIAADRYIRQGIIQPVFEKDKMLPECIKYRKTPTHTFSVMVLGMVVFATMSFLQLHLPFLRHSLDGVGSLSSS